MGKETKTLVLRYCKPQTSCFQPLLHALLPGLGLMQACSKPALLTSPAAPPQEHCRPPKHSCLSL